MGNKIYTIQVLGDKDYNALHEQFSNIKEEDLKNSLGFADVEKGEAYVRKTNVATLDETTMQHELQELLAKSSSHEDINNIRWKKGMDIITPILQAVAVVTGHPYIAAGIGAARGAYKQATDQGTLGQTLISTAAPLAAGALGAGAAGGAAFTTAQEAGKGVLSSLGSSLAAGTGQLLGITPAAAAPTLAEKAATAIIPGATALGMQAAGSTLASAAPALLPAVAAGTVGANLLGAVKPAIPGVSATPATPAIQGAGQVTPTVAPTTVAAPATAAAPAAAPFSLKSLVTPQNILGAGSLLASQAVKQPVFQMPESVELIRSKLLETQDVINEATGEVTKGGGLTEVGKQARIELANIMKSTPTELYPTATDEYYNAALRRTRESYAQAQKQLDAAYNLAGVYGSGEHLAEKAKLQENLARTESALTAETEQRRFELARNAQYQAIQDSLGVDKDVMDDLVGLTGLDVQTAAMMYGAQVQDVQQIRESLGTLGVELLIRGTTGQMKTGGININLGQ